MRTILLSIFLFCFSALSVCAEMDSLKDPLSGEEQGEVLILNMQMGILPGTFGYLQEAIEHAEKEQYNLIIIELSTPGGILSTTQDMIQSISKSRVPIVMYVSPSGGSATSAGVFITVASHVAVMAPGTSIGAAHPVAGDGKDIEGDMREKAENMAVAMVRSITRTRGRNIEWVEKAVRESASITAEEAVEAKVVDFIAKDIDELLRRIDGMKIEVNGTHTSLRNLQSARRIRHEISFRHFVLNLLSNPSVASILWVLAGIGLWTEVTNPGLIFPGVVGAICFLLALISMQVLQLNQGAVALIFVGSGLLLAELFVPSGILGIGGLIAIVIGFIYLSTGSLVPEVHVQYEIIIPIVVALSALVMLFGWKLRTFLQRPPSLGFDALIGKDATAMESFTGVGQVKVFGEIWKAHCEGSVERGEVLVVTERTDGLALKVERKNEHETN